MRDGRVSMGGWVLVCLVGLAAGGAGDWVRAAAPRDGGPAAPDWPVAAAPSVTGEWIDIGDASLMVLAALSGIGLVSVFGFGEFLRDDQLMPRPFLLRLRRLLSAGRFDEAARACLRNRSPVALIALPAIEYRRRNERFDPQIIKDLMAGELHRQGNRIERGVRYLRDVAELAPVLGLLGAGWGWLTALNGFGRMAAQAGPAVLGDALTRAWTAAGVGCLVGIIALLAHAVFRGRQARQRGLLELGTIEVFAMLVRKTAS